MTRNREPPPAASSMATLPPCQFATSETSDRPRPKPSVPAAEVPHDDDDRAVAIVYTSGTTGIPKGATYCWRNIEAIRRIDAAFDPQPAPKTLAAIPLAHMGFMSRIGANIHKRACTVLMQRWTARTTLEAIERERLTVLGGIPTQLALMLLDPDIGGFAFPAIVRSLKVNEVECTLRILTAGPFTLLIVQGPIT